jgi:hypothetical protein
MARTSRLPILFLVACALFLRLWVPAGWMPASGAGAFAIEPCAAAAPMTMGKGDAGHHGSSHKGQHEGDCAFAPHHGGAATPDLSSPILAPVLADAQTPHQQIGTVFARGPPAPPPPATGPPALA